MSQDKSCRRTERQSELDAYLSGDKGKNDECVTNLEVLNTSRVASKPSEVNEAADAQAVQKIEKIEKIVTLLQEEFAKLNRERQRKSTYRKNARVIYLPKKEPYETVLRKFRGSADEPLRKTIERIFTELAKSLSEG